VKKGACTPPSNRSFHILDGITSIILHHKTKIYLHRTFVRQRTNAPVIQLLFLLCMADCLAVMPDYARF
jgi:hypothetical protein